MVKKRDSMPPYAATDEAIVQFWDIHSLTDYLDELEIADDVVFVKPKKKVHRRNRGNNLVCPDSK